VYTFFVSWSLNDLNYAFERCKNTVDNEKKLWVLQVTLLNQTTLKKAAAAWLSRAPSQFLDLGEREKPVKEMYVKRQTW